MFTYKCLETTNISGYKFIDKHPDSIRPDFVFSDGFLINHPLNDEFLEKWNELRWSNDPNTTLVPYDPTWPIKAKEEIDLLSKYFEGVEYKIAHIGSTAVSGMPARPTIDIIVGIISNPNGITRDIKILEEIGYSLRTEETQDGFGDEDERLFLVKQNPENPSGNPLFALHICLYHSDYWRVRLLVRDTLRNNGMLRQYYKKIKKMTIDRYPGDRYNYFREKSIAINRILTHISYIGKRHGTD